jgi:cell division protein FtsB
MCCYLIFASVCPMFRKNIVQQIVASVVFGLIALYLGYHGLHGHRGYYAWQEKKITLLQLTKREKSLANKNHILKKQVSLLQENIDLDLLEQYMWKLFRNIDPEKKVILCT